MKTSSEEQKIQLNLELILPNVLDERDECIDRLNQELRSIRGITESHLKSVEGKTLLCLHYEASLISISNLKRLAQRAGGAISNRYQHRLLPVSGMDCSDCTLVIEHGIKRLEGILDVTVSYVAGTLKVEYDTQKVSETDIKNRIKALGYEVRKTGVSEFLSERRELIFSLLCGFSLVTAWLTLKFGLPLMLTYVLFGSTYFFGGFDIARHAVHSIKERQLDTDLLMVLAAGGAAFLGEFAEGGLLLFLFSLGHALEELALDKARDAVSKLGKLTPKTATIKRDGVEVEASVDELQINDLVIIRPGVRIAADGVIVNGVTTVDQSPITGESLPIDKQPGDQVFAGSINGNGALQVRVSKLAKDNTLSRVMQLVEESQTQKTKAQRLTEKFTSWFVPTVLIIDVLLIVVPSFLGMPFKTSFFRAMTFLVAVSPCALALGPPSAMLAAIAQAARNGLLIKGGIHLETLGSLKAIAFDKTGTLTHGKPEVTDIVTFGDTKEIEILALAASAESRSGHPLAAAVVAAANKRSIQIPEAESVDSVNGQGLIATIFGENILVGNIKLMQAQNIEITEEILNSLSALEKEGKTSILVARQKSLKAIIALADTPRENAKQSIAELRRLGIEHIFLLSGDNTRVAQKLAYDLGIDQVKAELMPEEKVKHMQELSSNRVVAMVGDGVNDAPALAAASVGIAMGGASTDVALETADVALMGDDLSRLPFAISLGKATRGVVIQNLVIALGTIIVLAIAGITGNTSIGWAILFHEGSTLLVVANSLRLLSHR